MNSEKILTFETNMSLLLFFSVMLSVTWTPLFNLPTVFYPTRTLSHVWCLWMLLIRYSSHKLHWVALLYLGIFVCQDVCVGRVCCWFFSYFERILDWNSNFVSINTIFHIDLLNEFLEATWSLLSTKLQIYFINDVFLPVSSVFFWSVGESRWNETRNRLLWGLTYQLVK